MSQSKWRPRRPCWGRSVRPRFLHTLLAALLLPGVIDAQPRPVPQDVAVSLEGALLVPRLGLAFAMRPGGGIDAVELGDGRVRWHSDQATRPLAALGDRLVAQADSLHAGSLELVTLDARDGAARASLRVPIAAGVTATAVDSPAGSFRVWAAAADSRLVVRWEHSAATATGPAQGYLPAESEGQVPSVGGGEAVVSVDGSSLRLESASPLRKTAAEAVERPGLEEVSAAAEGGAGRRFLSADDRHVLVSERVESAEFTLHQHRWTVYERASGARLGALRALVSATPFVVVGTALYYTAPPHVVRREGRLARRGATLRAVDLQTGAEVWAKAVRDSAFRGPFPP